MTFETSSISSESIMSNIDLLLRCDGEKNSPEFVRAVAKEYLGYQDNNNLCKTDQQEGQTELKLEDIINFVVDVVLRNTA